ncbi:MAG: VOC family protein [Planctomycetota bacterium]
MPTKDFELSLAFYERLGWRVNWRDGGLAEIELAGQSLLLQDYYAKEWAENFMVHVIVDDAAAWHRHAADVVASGDFPTASVREPKKQDYGALVTFVHDPCGVLLHFAEVLTAKAGA